MKKAINSPLLETSIEGAENLLINTSGKVDIMALNEAISYVRELAGNNVNIIWGTVTQEDYDEEKIIVTVIATGMTKDEKTSKKNNETEKEDFLLEEFVMPAPKKELEIIMPPFLVEAGKRGDKIRKSRW